MSSYGVKVALRPVLCDDVCDVIQYIVNRERLKEVHAEYFQKLSKFVENKIDEISMEMDENTLTEYGIRDLEKDQEQCEWSYVLDDIFYNSGKIVNSQYRPDATIM